MKANNWKDKLGALLPDGYSPETEAPDEKKQVSAPGQVLRIELDKRNGKAATLITEFQGTDDELKELARTLKNKCATGGSQRDGEILLQGDFRIKVAGFLQEMGYKVKKINFK